MAATRKEQQMNSLTRNGILRICLTTAAALALAAPAGAHNASMVARYGWGAAATVAKRQSSKEASNEHKSTISTAEALSIIIIICII